MPDVDINTAAATAETRTMDMNIMSVPIPICAYSVLLIVAFLFALIFHLKSYNNGFKYKDVTVVPVSREHRYKDVYTV